MNLVVVVVIVSVPLCLCCIVVRYNVIPGCVDPTRSGQERESHRLFIDDDYNNNKGEEKKEKIDDVIASPQ